MEDTLMIVFSFLICVIVLFLFPLYTVFELKDNLDYAQVLKYTVEFAKEVTNKGYITLDMYNNFEAKLASNGNMYKIYMQHKHYIDYPIIYAYDNDENIKISGKFEYELYKNNDGSLPNQIVYNGIAYSNLLLGYDRIEEIIYQDEIVAYLYKYVNYDFEQENINIYKYQNIYPLHNISHLTLGKVVAYVLNAGDEFNVRVININETISTNIYSLLFKVATGNSIKIYVNYGGAVTANGTYTDVTFNITE